MLTRQDPEFYELHERLMAAGRQAHLGRDAAERAVFARAQSENRGDRKRSSTVESNVVYPHAWRR